MNITRHEMLKHKNTHTPQPDVELGNVGFQSNFAKPPEKKRTFVIQEKGCDMPCSHLEI